MPLDGAQVVTSSASSALFEGIADNGWFFLDWINTPEDVVGMTLERLRAALRCNAAWMLHAEGRSPDEVAPIIAEAGYQDLATAKGRIAFLRHGLLGRILSRTRLSRDEWIFVIFGVLSVVWTAYALSLALTFWQTRLSTSLQVLLGSNYGILTKVLVLLSAGEYARLKRRDRHNHPLQVVEPGEPPGEPVSRPLELREVSTRRRSFLTTAARPPEVLPPARARGEHLPS